MTTNVLFLCPHNAAKSLLAMAWFQHFAAQRTLDARADSAGTEPDAVIMPSVSTFLDSQGMSTAGARPRHVTDADLQRADRVVSMGCDLSPFAFDAPMERWDDIPAVSDDLQRANAAIQQRVLALVESLAV